MGKRHHSIANRRILLILAAISVAAGVVALFVMLWVSRTPHAAWFGKPDPAQRPAYDINLTDQTGKPFRLHDLLGNVVLLNFGFTHCTNICPSTLAALANVMRALPPEAQERVRIVFVTVDPERDTPAKVAEFVRFYDQRFTGLTGDAASIAATAKAYGAVFNRTGQDGNGGYSLEHSTSVCLIDPAGRVRLVYGFDQLPESGHIAGDILRILGMPAMAEPPAPRN